MYQLHVWALGRSNVVGTSDFRICSAGREHDAYEVGEGRDAVHEDPKFRQTDGLARTLTNKQIA
jgi:hypothetical protein